MPATLPIQLVPRLDPLPERHLVLVVDDEGALLALDLRILAQENFQVVTASSGENAIALVERMGRLPDLLITDFMMPDMDGRELVEALRARKPELKVLYQTGYSDKLFGPRGLLEPDTAFLEKPFTPRGLREAARLALYGAIDPE